MPGCVELLSPCAQSPLSALTGAATHPDGSRSLRSPVSANRCVAPGYKTVPRMRILAVPSTRAATRYGSIVPNGLHWLPRFARRSRAPLDGEQDSRLRTALV